MRYAVRQIRTPDGTPCAGDYVTRDFLFEGEPTSHPDVKRAWTFADRAEAAAESEKRGPCFAVVEVAS